MPIVEVTHRTTYNYARPVEIGPHAMMLTPRVAFHDILSARVDITPGPAGSITHSTDSFGNLIQHASFPEDVMASRLDIVSSIRVRHTPRTPEDVLRAMTQMAGRPEDAALREDGMRALRRSRSGNNVLEWARSFEQHGAMDDFTLMQTICANIYSGFTYARREAGGAQDPDETLRLGTGSCRDFAVLMTEAARSVGLPARFASGYLYDDRTIVEEDLAGGGATHGWVEVLLPGAGWVEFDPTNNLVAGRCLLSCAVTLDQSSPIDGTYYGDAADYLGMEVDVRTRSFEEPRPQEARRLQAVPAL